MWHTEMSDLVCFCFLTNPCIWRFSKCNKHMNYCAEVPYSCCIDQLFDHADGQNRSSCFHIVRRCCLLSILCSCSCCCATCCPLHIFREYRNIFLQYMWLSCCNFVLETQSTKSRGILEKLYCWKPVLLLAFWQSLFCNYWKIICVSLVCLCSFRCVLDTIMFQFVLLHHLLSSLIYFAVTICETQRCVLFIVGSPSYS